VKIPEFKACAAAIERLDATVPESPAPPRNNFTAASAPKLFTYVRAEGKSKEETEGKVF
jgi:hypothetical protein